MANFYIVDMMLYPIFEQVPPGKETEASIAAQEKINGSVLSSTQLRWRNMVFTASDSDELADKLNQMSQSDLTASIQGTIGGIVSGVSVAQPGEWTPTGGGHHASYMPVIADVAGVTGPTPTEWGLSTPLPSGGTLSFIVFAAIRWKQVTVI